MKKGKEEQVFYVVVKGHKPGIYYDSINYTKQMSGFSGARGCKTSSYEEVRIAHGHCGVVCQILLTGAHE